MLYIGNCRTVFPVERKGKTEMRYKLISHHDLARRLKKEKTRKNFDEKRFSRLSLYALCIEGIKREYFSRRIPEFLTIRTIQKPNNERK